MISQDTINAVLDRADIVSVISEYVPELAKRGTDYVCCCPFHQEKTASFHVSAARQTWHCFGGCQEGGNVISFLMKKQGMTFPQAVESLAKRYGIDFFEEQEADEVRQQRLHKEALWGINERAAEYYASLLLDPSNADALAYAEKRFGQDYVREVGMGFAPKTGDALVVWARSIGQNLDLMLEVNLIGRDVERGRYYDFYRNRLVIPIRDRQRHVIGFTARDLSGKNDCKYLNSKESLVYHKKQSLFGLDEAIREAARKEQFFIVEGAPDALKMHSVGIFNVVAPLGGALTAEQLRLLKPIARNVCFINDADPPKEGERFGVGIEYVMKNGKFALMEGFAVSVREIPIGEGNTKQDPGSFFSDKANLDLLPEEEFVGWLARKIWDDKGNALQKTEAIKTIADNAQYIEDDTRLDMLLDELVKLRRGRDFWRSRIYATKWTRLKEEEKDTQVVDLHKYGFFEENSCYYGLTDKGEVFWCNFTLKPLFHIRDNDRPRRLFEIHNTAGRTETIEMIPEELISLARFRNKLESIGNFVWKAGEQEMIKLKMYLFDNTKTARLVKQLGWNNAGFYAFGNGIWFDGVFHSADKHGIVRREISNSDEVDDSSENTSKSKRKFEYWYIPAAAHTYERDGSAYERQRKFVYLPYNKVNFGEYMQKFVKVYGDNGKIGLCYWLASLFRDIVTSHTRSFPLLNLFGPKGSGKTELGAALMAFFVADNKAPNLKNATPVALNDDVAYVCDALVHFDEYKNGLKPSMIEFLKGLYDGVGRVKMGGANYEDRKMTSVKTGVVFSGQEIPTADIALFHRCIFLSFQRSEFSVEELNRFTELRKIQEHGLTALTLQVLQTRRLVEAGFASAYGQVTAQVQAQLDGKPIETRIMENWCKPLAVFRCLQQRLEFPFTYDDLFFICFKWMVRQNGMSGEGNELAHFWRTLMYLRDSGLLFEKGDFRIKCYTRFSSDIINNRLFAEAHPVLLLNTSRVFNLYKESARKSGDKIIPDDALREYLKNTHYFLGTVKSVRFTSFKNGYVENQPDVNNVMRPVSRINRAMAFDYEEVKKLYGVSLDAEDPLHPAEETDTEGADKPRQVVEEPQLPF